MLLMEESSRGLILLVKAQPGSRRNGVTGTHDGALKIAVSQAPEKGKANTAIVKILAQIFDLSRSQIELVSGQSSSHKKFLIQGVSAEELSIKIRSLLSANEAKLN